MNHRIFERKLRPLDIQGACLSECRVKINTLRCGLGVQVSSFSLVSRSAWTRLVCTARTERKAQLASVLSSVCVNRTWLCSNSSLDETYQLWPQIRQDYPLNLSILISGGEENNCDILSSGERKGSSTSSNCILCKLSRTKFIGSVCYVVSLEKVMYCGDNPFHFSPSYVCG